MVKDSIRVNKTMGNLKRIWSQLDDASGNLYNAVESADRMIDMPKELRDLLDRLDISAINSVKNLVEEMIVERGGEIDDIAVNSEKESVKKAVNYARTQMTDRIEELEGFLDVRPYSPLQRRNLERKLEGYKEDLKEFKSIKL